MFHLMKDAGLYGLGSGLMHLNTFFACRLSDGGSDRSGASRQPSKIPRVAGLSSNMSTPRQSSPGNDHSPTQAQLQAYPLQMSLLLWT